MVLYVVNIYNILCVEFKRCFKFTKHLKSTYKMFINKNISQDSLNT